jgi:NodT family efflux transporter outer membrane factor (OMF) lipoprotein
MSALAGGFGRWHTRGLIALCVAGASGCNLAPVYHAPAVETPVAFKEAGAWQPAQPSDSIARGAWWRMYGDPLLDSLEDQVDKANPTLRAESAAYAQARAFDEEAQSALFPRLDLGGGLSTDKQSLHRPLRGSGEPTYYGANTLDATTSYELDLWGRVRDAVAAAKAETEAGGADLESVRLMLHAELATDYVGLRGLDEQAKLLTDTVSAYSEAYDLTKSLFQGKIASPIDVTRAETQLHDAQAQVSDVIGRRALLEHAIATLVGRPPAELSIDTEPVPVSVPNIPAGVPSTLLQRRPDIASAERKVAASNQLVGVAKAAFFPTISLTGTAGFQNTSLNLLNYPESIWSIGPNMSLPIFEGGLLRAKLRAAKAAFEESSDDYRATVLKAFREVEDDLSMLHWLAEQSRQEDEAAHSAQETVDMSMLLYRNGADSYLDVVTAQTAALDAQRSVLLLRTRQVQASIALIRALGGGWSTTDAS